MLVVACQAATTFVARRRRTPPTMKAALRARIERLDWMGPTTKLEAQNKLDAYIIKVGYPDHWRDYSTFVIRRDDLLGACAARLRRSRRSSSTGATGRSTAATGHDAPDGRRL